MSAVENIVVFKPSLKSIETSPLGVNEILSFFSKASKSACSSISYDLRQTDYMDGNLSALLVAMIHKLKVEYGKRVEVKVPEKMHVLLRNGMQAHLAGLGNYNPVQDDRESTIPLYSFDVADEDFSRYLTEDFFGHRGLGGLSNTVKRNLRTHFIEVFNNVELHANSCHPLFTCGQYFPNLEILKFSMVDLGDGFLRKINKFTNGVITTDTEAIKWALDKNNSTKDPEFGTGGTGLKDLKTYCEANNGKLQIASGNNIVTFEKGKVESYKIPSPMLGAIVNLTFSGL